MKLYKYVSLEAAHAILETCSLGFTRASSFNDPFDIPTSIPELSINAADAIFKGIKAQAKDIIWEENYGILALTRTATNPLMWAHYADEHRGAVVEIDTHIARLTDEDTNFIPAQFGSVIYSRRRLENQYLSNFKTGVSVGGEHRFRIDHYEKWQRIFLTKSLDWSYEEEVRVIKCLKGINENCKKNESGNFEIMGVKNNKSIFCFRIPRSGIISLTVGARVAQHEIAALRERHPNLLLRKGVLEKSVFQVKIVELT